MSWRHPESEELKSYVQQNAYYIAIFLLLTVLMALNFGTYMGLMINGLLILIAIVLIWRFVRLLLNTEEWFDN